MLYIRLCRMRGWELPRISEMRSSQKSQNANFAFGAFCELRMKPRHNVWDVWRDQAWPGKRDTGDQVLAISPLDRLLMHTIGSRRRSALTRSRMRVSSFSFPSSSLRAASHSSGDTTSGRCMPALISAPVSRTWWRPVARPAPWARTPAVAPGPRRCHCSPSQESHIGVAVVDPLTSALPADQREEHDTEALNHSGLQQGATQGEAAHGAHGRLALLHLWDGFDAILTEEPAVR